MEATASFAVQLVRCPIQRLWPLVRVAGRGGGVDSISCWITSRRRRRGQHRCVPMSGSRTGRFSVRGRCARRCKGREVRPGEARRRHAP